MLESIFNSKFGVNNSVLVNIMHNALMIDSFLYYAYIAQSSLDPNSKCVDVFIRVFIVFLIY